MPDPALPLLLPEASPSAAALPVFGMTQTRSARRKTFALGEMSELNKSVSLTRQGGSTRKLKVRAAPKKRGAAFSANTARPATRLSAITKGKKRKLGGLPDEKRSKAPALNAQDRRSGQTTSKTTLNGRNKAKDDGDTGQGQEKRLRRYRDKPPQSFLEKLHRAQTQRYIFNEAWQSLFLRSLG